LTNSIQGVVKEVNKLKGYSRLNKRNQLHMLKIN